MEYQDLTESVEKYFELDPKKDHALINILNPSENAADCIVLNIGSSSIKLGVASQLEPFMVPNAIAYQKYGTQEEKKLETESDKSNPNVESIINSVESDLRIKQYILGDPKNYKNHIPNLVGFKVFDDSNAIEKHYNMDIDDDDDQRRFEHDLFTDTPEDYIWNKNFTFTKVPKTITKPRYYIGEEALSLHYKEKYQVFYPVRNGYLNVTKTRTAQSWIDALQLILTKSITEKLRIPQKHFKHFRCVVAIPDLINK